MLNRLAQQSVYLHQLRTIVLRPSDLVKSRLLLKIHDLKAIAATISAAITLMGGPLREECRILPGFRGPAFVAGRTILLGCVASSYVFTVGMACLG